MSSGQNTSWKPGKRDILFLAIIAAVVLLLVIGTGDRTTKAVPNDATHLAVGQLKDGQTEACMGCHSAEGVYPQPQGHIKIGQCFQCHVQPDDWGSSK